MKRLATPLLLAALVCSAATASAQTIFRLGVRGGLNRALTTVASPNYVSGGAYYSADKSAIYSWQAGLVLEANFNKFAFQPAILFSQKGEKLGAYTSLSGINGISRLQTTSANRYNWLELPLNVVYTLHGDHGLQVFAGPYVALAVGGRQKGTSISYTPIGVAGGFRTTDFNDKISYGSDTNNRRLDVGFNFGLGYRQGPVQIQLSYGLGLRDLHRADPPSIDPSFSPFSHNFNADAAYNRVAQLTGTYFFAL